MQVVSSVFIILLLFDENIKWPGHSSNVPLLDADVFIAPRKHLSFSRDN